MCQADFNTLKEMSLGGLQVGEGDCVAFLLSGRTLQIVRCWLAAGSLVNQWTAETWGRARFCATIVPVMPQHASPISFEPVTFW
jgi:hypothetical protein